MRVLLVGVSDASDAFGIASDSNHRRLGRTLQMGDFQKRMEFAAVMVELIPERSRKAPSLLTNITD